MERRNLVPLLKLLFFCVVMKVTTSDKGGPPFKSYPMLYFSSEDIAELRSRTSSTHEKIATDIREAGEALVSQPSLYLPPESHTVFASRWNEVYGNRLNGFAMYCFLYPQDDEAFGHVKKYMDIMASYPDWYVAISKGKDQVPVGHSLTGFATAFDFLYDRFDRARRKKYLSVIKTTSEHLYSCLTSERFGWTKQYIHNHAASNIIALLLGALVVSVKEPAIAAPWLSEAQDHLDTAMKVLKHVTDGSLDEGVSYGSYTSRGLTQYVYLAKRHFGIDHTGNPWLKKHFWFYYKTILPGFQRTVGIGDANHNWFFGPISQLVMLDSYAMRNGYGYWLAGKIRRAKPKNKPLAPSNSNCWSMLHTEFIFFNPSIRPQKPPVCPENRLHIYSDWGVVTYGGGQDMKTGNTFLSFKSAMPNGEAAEYLVFDKAYPSKVTGWQNFNPGHEHPDQNSFVFAPNGRYFITEALYGPKLTYLDNVYTFAPSGTSNCNQPWEGQLGECQKWLKYQTFEKGMRGEILTATTSGNMAFIAGEAAGVYRDSLGLSSVFRGVLLLDPEILVVVDSIKLKPGSTTKMASATFHNMLLKFRQYSHFGYQGAQILYPEGSYRMFSIKVGGGPVNVTINNGIRPQYLREGPTNYINATYTLDKDVTNVIHVFSGPRRIIKSVNVQYKSSISGILIKININGVEHQVDISTLTKGVSRKLNAIQSRIDVTGFAGYARVRIGGEDNFFGYQNRPIAGNEIISSKSNELGSYVSQEDSEVVPKSLKFTLTSTDDCRVPFKKLNSKPIETTSDKWIKEYSPPLLLLMAAISIAFVLLIALTIPPVKRKIIRKVRNAECTTVLAVTALALLVTANLYCIDSTGGNTCIGNKMVRIPRSVNSTEPIKDDFPSSPFVFLTSLPGSGGSLLESLFANPDDFLSFSTTHNEMTIPTGSLSSAYPDLCIWSNQLNKYSIHATGWFTSLRIRPMMHFNQMKDSEYVRKIQRQVRKHHSGITALSDNTGFWLTKLPWMRGVIGKENFLPVLIVRDPRSWIDAITSDKNRLRRRRTLSSLMSAYDNIEKSCDGSGVKLPSYYHHFERLQEARQGELRVSEKLAVVWTIAISNAITNEEVYEGQRPLHIVRFEDVLKDAEGTSTDLFSKLGFPLGIRYMNKLTRLVSSEFFQVPYDGVITPKTLDLWKTRLPNSEIDRINEICCPLMKILNYDC